MVISSAAATRARSIRPGQAIVGAAVKPLIDSKVGPATAVPLRRCAPRLVIARRGVVCFAISLHSLGSHSKYRLGLRKAEQRRDQTVQDVALAHQELVEGELFHQREQHCGAADDDVGAARLDQQ